MNATPVLIGTSSSGPNFSISYDTTQLPTGNYKLSWMVTDSYGVTSSNSNIGYNTYYLIDNNTSSTTTTPPDGAGTGGTAYTDMAPAGTTLGGFTGSFGAYIDSITPIWHSLGANAMPVGSGSAHGGSGGVSFPPGVTCDNGNTAVGLVTCFKANVLVRVGLVCGSSSGDSSPLVYSLSGNDSIGCTSSTRTCPAGTTVIGIQGRSGQYNDEIGLICR